MDRVDGNLRECIRLHRHLRRFAKLCAFGEWKNRKTLVLRSELQSAKQQKPLIFGDIPARALVGVGLASREGDMKDKVPYIREA